MIDRYKHLNESDRQGGHGVVVGIEDIAEQIERMNYGMHRMLSALVRARRAATAKKADRWDAEIRAKHNELADRIEALLNEGLF